MPKPGLLSAQLMNGHSDMWTKLRLGALYPGVKGHAKAPRQNGKPEPDRVTRPHMQEGHNGTQRVARAYLSSLLGAPLGTVLWFVGHTRAIEEEEGASTSEIMKAH